MRLERFPGVRQLPALATRRRDDVVLFDSWRGMYSDNPRAISEALRERRPDLEQVWVANGDVAGLLPPDVTSVEFGSRAYIAQLGRAGHVVADTGMPGYYRKPRGTRYLQTWHGTPLKKIAFDLGGPSFAEDAKFFERLRNDVAKWDALLSPNPFSTEVLRRAFRYDGEILETGYPRNDMLSAPDASERRAAVRKALGIPESVRAVLYAPTWRDAKSRFIPQLDVAALGRAVGDDHRLLLRSHPLTPLVLDDEQRRWADDVWAYPDVRELYLAADVLVTDYSSASFDFAVTGKPMLFFTYDLVEYRDEMRGFYLDFEEEAPGPLLATTSDVAAALADLDTVVEAHRAKYERFVERYCSLEDGAASRRVIDAFF